VEDYYRRRAHSIEEVVHTWLKAPGVMVVSEGTVMVVRRLADRVTVLTATNDAVTLDLDATTHLPLCRTFRWRNPQFNDYDEESETYDDYHTIQGPAHAAHHHADTTTARCPASGFLTRVVYNLPLAPSLFDPRRPAQEKVTATSRIVILSAAKNPRIRLSIEPRTPPRIYTQACHE